MMEWTIAILIHAVVPLIGLALYLRLERRMKNENVPESLATQLFWIFGTYGVLIILILTALFWKWSGMASIGMFGLFIFGPIIMGYCAYDNKSVRNLTKYHEYAYLSSVAFFGILAILVTLGIVAAFLR